MKLDFKHPPMPGNASKRLRISAFVLGFTVCFVLLVLHPAHDAIYGREFEAFGAEDTEILVQNALELSPAGLTVAGMTSGGLDVVRSLILPVIDIEQTQQTQAHEIISVAPPVPDYGIPVYSTQLFNHTFGNSYGNPYIGQFKPPPIQFNRVIVTLKTSIDRSQYDRLAHFHVNGSEIWRTSTIEPGGVLAYSIFSKDVSSYVSLFTQPTSYIFQLDNVLDDGIQGRFTTVLTADFYQVDELPTGQQNDIAGQLSADIPRDLQLPDLFSIQRPPDSVYSLTYQGSENKPPLVNIVDSPYTVRIPAISPQTSRLVLSVITSGNANEEFWYDNELGSQYGPIRVINIYYDGHKIAVQAPEPVIFTGGISPLFWNPVVSTDAFDLPTIDIDLTALLPELNANTSHTLSIQVSNGIGEWQDPSTSVGFDWITAANLLAWEDTSIASVTGVVGAARGSSTGTLVASTVYTEELQVIDSRHCGGISSQVQYNLKDGYSFVVNASISSSALITNSQTNMNESASIAHYSKTVNSATIFSSSGVLLTENTFTGVYPLTLSTYAVPTDNASISETINDLYHVKGVTISGDLQSELSLRQNGTAQMKLAKYVIGGNGFLSTNYQYSEEGGVTNNRQVNGGAANIRAVGQIVSDVSWVSPEVVPDSLLSIKNFVATIWEVLGDVSVFGETVTTAQTILDGVEASY